MQSPASCGIAELALTIGSRDVAFFVILIYQIAIVSIDVVSVCDLNVFRVNVYLPDCV